MITGSTLEYSQISQGSKICHIVGSYSLDTVVKENMSTLSREERCFLNLQYLFKRIQ